MAKKAQYSVSRAPSGSSVNLPAPIGGWNTRDPLSMMEPTDAIVMTNINPGTNNVSVRKGYKQFAYGVGEPNFALEYNNGSLRQLIVASGSSVWSVDTSGATTLIGSGFLSDKWQAVNFRGRLFMVNGQDVPQTWDGVTLSASGWTGVGLNPPDLNNVIVFKRRLYFASNDSGSFWYAGLDNITGPLTEFPLNNLGMTGGYLKAMGAWSVDPGARMESTVVFCMNNGDTFVYGGYDPAGSTPQEWSLIAQFKTGIPVSSRGLVNVNSELILMTNSGFIPLSKYVNSGETVVQIPYISDKIRPTVADVTAKYINNYGWQAVHYPNDNQIIFNIPVDPDADQFEQYVYNILTGAWAKWENLHARTWVYFNNKMYFCGKSEGGLWNVSPWYVTPWETSGLYEFGVAFNDSTEPIRGIVRQAFNNFGEPGNLKHVRGIRCNLQLDPNFETKICLYADYKVEGTCTQIVDTTNFGTYWDVGVWDVSFWTGGQIILGNWGTLGTYGHVISVELMTSTDQEPFNWYSTDMIVKKGQIL